MFFVFLFVLYSTIYNRVLCGSSGLKNDDDRLEKPDDSGILNKSKEIFLYLPKEIEKVSSDIGFKMAINASFVKGTKLELTLPGITGADCSTVLHFHDSSDQTAIAITPSDTDFPDSIYILNKNDITLLLGLEQLFDSLLISVQKFQDVKQYVDAWKVQNIYNIEYIILNGGLTHINSISFEFEPKLIDLAK